MELELYNTLTRKIEPLEPINSLDVRMYVCGPTVYDYAHIGNARPVIVFDVLFRLLRHIYGESHVKYVRNITDVDDKINARAAERGIDIRELTEETYQNFKADVAALGCLPPTVEPRATEHIEEMKAIIERLIAGKFAYIEQDHVLFSPNAMNAANGVLPRYGALANRSLDEMIAGARVDVAPYKRDVTDFVLWKPSKAGEPSWPSPGGIRTQGRPGWHIECSAMSWKHLGETFDIHGGGVDLVFPHHENEIAQSCCAFGRPVMASHWMHNGFLQVEGQKMSKSLGNFKTISDLRSDWQGEVIRYQMLMTHYRQPVDWTETSSREAQYIVDRWYEFLGDAEHFEDGEVDLQVIEALSNDLNTPEALGRLASLYEAAKKNNAASGAFVSTARFLGFFQKMPHEYFAFYKEMGGLVPKSSPLIPEELKVARDRARSNREFEKSDYLRNIIYLYGYRVKDGAGNKSELIPAEKDFFSVSANVRAKLAGVARIGLAEAAKSNSGNVQPSFERGFVSKYGLLFNYSDDFASSLDEAYAALAKEIGSGAVTVEDLKSALVDVVLSNRAQPARFGADVVASAVLFKLFSGVVTSYQAFFDNFVLDVPSGLSWGIGSVSVVDASEWAREIPLKLAGMTSDKGANFEPPKLAFRVDLESSPAALSQRALILVRAFITANRFLMYRFGSRDEVFMPPSGALERGIEGGSSVPMRLARSDDGALVLPGRRASFPYRVSRDFVEFASRNELYSRFASILSLKLFNPVTPELLALDRLCRARSATDPFVRLFWNLEAVSTCCSVDNGSQMELGEAVEFKLLSMGLASKDISSLLKQAARLSKSRRSPGFVSSMEADASQSFSETIVMALLNCDLAE